MNWPTFQHEAMATTYQIVIAGHPAEYARQAAAAAFRELDRLENELSRYIESSDIGRANQLACGESIVVGEDTIDCLITAAEVSAATNRAFDPAYGSVPRADAEPGAPLYAVDPSAHTLTSLAERLHLDLGAVGKGFALDRMAATLREWDITSALLESGGSTALALAAPPGHAGWPVGLGEGAHHRVLDLVDAALSGSGTAVKGDHLVDPRTRAAAARTNRVWALAPTGAVADALSTAFFVLDDATVATFCQSQPTIGAALTTPDGTVRTWGRL